MYNKLTVEDVDVKGKRVLVRCDFNVPLNDKQEITDENRIVGALPTINYLIENGAKRLGFDNITTLENLGQNYREDLMGKDAIICDVPCSGIGIIPKKPDLRYKKLDDIKQLCQLQQEILCTAARYIKTGGRIVYSTCTINKAENQYQITQFLENHNDFRLAELNCPVKGAENDNNMVTFLPHTTGCDGFFVAVLEKIC